MNFFDPSHWQINTQIKLKMVSIFFFNDKEWKLISQQK